MSICIKDNIQNMNLVIGCTVGCAYCYARNNVRRFHMIKKIPYDQDEITMIKETANILTKVPAVFYTGHCTGKEAFAIMKEIMGEQLVLIHSGMEIE